MALTIQDFEDLVKLLNEHPEWRERLRSVLFPEWEEFRTAVSELLRESLALQRDVLDALRRLATRLESLAARVDELAEAQKRTEAQLQALTARVDELAEAQGALTVRMDELTQAQKELTVRMDTLAEILQGMRGEREGAKFEGQIRRAAFGIFRGGRNFRKDVEDALERAAAEGTIDWKAFRRVRATDLLWWKKPQGQPPVLLVAEVSLQVDQHDVDRVLQTARILTQLFPDLQVIPVVMGRDWSRPEVWEQARLWGVEWWIEKNEARSARLDSIIRVRPEVLQST
ncbi:Chromosome partition protein Smc [bacterium HR11]|nr:Chromosome partition protein Smc [bacterium HR11]